MNYYEQIKNEIVNNEITKRVKDYSKNKSDLTTYYNVGKLLSEAGKHYGEGIIKEYSKKLRIDLGINYNERTLRRFRQFYLFFKFSKWSTMSTKLTWSHFVELMNLSIVDEINYYFSICEKQNLSVRQLRERIKNKEYERLDEITKNKLINHGPLAVDDTIKNSVIIRNNLNYEEISERALQKLILEDIPSFLDELGSSFTFIRNEYPIRMGDSLNYIDLLLYNIDFNCYVKSN